jgi:hypothetical protein
MKKHLLSLILPILICWSVPSFAKDEKCVALAKLASTVYRNKASANEFQMLQTWEATSNPIDFAFIRLFTGLAFNVNKLTSNEFESATNDFCQRIVTAAITPESRFDNATPSNCESIVAHSQIINTFKQSGDTPTSLRKQFLKTYSQNNSVHRGIVDYLSLMSEMRFSNLLAPRSDEDFMKFPKKSCTAFISYTARIDSNR